MIQLNFEIRFLGFPKFSFKNECRVFLPRVESKLGCVKYNHSNIFTYKIELISSHRLPTKKDQKSGQAKTAYLTSCFALQEEMRQDNQSELFQLIGQFFNLIKSMAVWRIENCIEKPCLHTTSYTNKIVIILKVTDVILRPRYAVGSNCI